MINLCNYVNILHVVQKKINKESGICENFMQPTCILLYDIYLNIKINLNKYYCLLNNKTKILLVSFHEVSFLNQRHIDEKCSIYKLNVLFHQQYA